MVPAQGSCSNNGIVLLQLIQWGKKQTTRCEWVILIWNITLLYLKNLFIHLGHSSWEASALMTNDVNGFKCT